MYSCALDNEHYFVSAGVVCRMQWRLDVVSSEIKQNKVKIGQRLPASLSRMRTRENKTYGFSNIVYYIDIVLYDQGFLYIAYHTEITLYNQLFFFASSNSYVSLKMDSVSLICQ